MSYITVKRGINDVIHDADVTHSNCYALNARIWYGNCRCLRNDMLFSHEYGRVACYTQDVKRCSVGTALTRFLPTSINHIDITPKGKETIFCDITIDKIHAWNIMKRKHSNEIWRGSWIDITNFISQEFEIINTTLTLKFDKTVWEGQLLKIDINCLAQCLLLKVEGTISYPFNIGKLNRSSHYKEKKKIESERSNTVIVVCVVLFLSPLLLLSIRIIVYFIDKKDEWCYCTKRRSYVNNAVRRGNASSEKTYCDHEEDEVGDDGQLSFSNPVYEDVSFSETTT